MKACLNQMLESEICKLEADLASEGELVPAFRQALTDARKFLAESFSAGENADTLISGYSRFMDNVMRLAWQRFSWPEKTHGWRKSRISLLAVGGYGRQELLPNSDIDLLILLERNNHSTHHESIQKFTTLLWDLGLNVGHSVRSLSECKTQAAADVTILTAMMESRTLIGDDDLQDRMQTQISPRHLWDAKAFYLAKRKEQLDRHEKFDHTEYSLEPNVKSSPGGLRDIQTLTWIAKRRYGTESFADLADQGILAHEESQTLTKARSELWKIRFGLHLLANRDENRLLFEHQQKLAQMFGYEDSDQMAVEQFMKRYYRTALDVNTINETLFQHFDEVIVQAGASLQVRQVNERFRVVNGQLEATSEDVFLRSPSSLLEMFVIIGTDESIEGVRAPTIRLAQAALHLIDDEFRADPKNTAMFLSLLGCNHHLFTQLRRMGRWGILGRYLPEFDRVIGQMQFDLFHVYTVDAHSLQVVRNMRRFRYKNNEQQFPIAAHIHSRLPRIELLYIAGLYHDIAKGMGGDHSELGADIARDFCERHRLPTWDANLVCWLVQNHLVMSTTAQRKDIQNPEVIHEFARFVGEQVRLDYLYALTVADMNATNPNLWNGWRAALMGQLYSETRKALRHGLEEPIDRTDYVADVQQQAIDKLAEHKADLSGIEALWNHVDDEYFVHERVSDIVWHTEAILNRNEPEGPVILVRDDTSRRTETGFTQIFIHTQNRRDLFLAIVSAIDQLNLHIVDARIATSASDMTFNTFTVLENNGQPVGDKSARVGKIQSTIKKYLAQGKISPAKPRRVLNMFRQFNYKTQVNLAQDSVRGMTSLEVISPDRPGLVAVIARVLADFGVNLVSARITTLGERVEDLFYVTNQSGMPLTDETALNKLAASICAGLDEHVEAFQ